MGYKVRQCCWIAEHAESSTFLVASQSSWDLSWTQKSGSAWERHREGGGIGGRAWARVQSTVDGGMWVGGRRTLLVGGSLQGSMSPTHHVQLPHHIQLLHHMDAPGAFNDSWEMLLGPGLWPGPGHGAFAAAAP